MTVNVIPRLKLNDKFYNVDLKTFNDFYIIAVKEKETKRDTIKVDNVRKVRFEIAIDSGIKDKPLTIQYINLDFNDITSGNNEINKITAFQRLLNMPQNFYIKPVSVDDGQKEIKSGETSITININAMKLN